MVSLLTLAGPVFGDEPWLERYEILLDGASPTSGERLASAEVLLVPADLLSLAPGGGWELTVHPWETWSGAENTGGGCDPVASCPICSSSEPFYGQAGARGSCSGVLVGNDQVLTAGHCMSAATGESCSDYYVVFDYAVSGENDPLGGPWPVDTKVPLDSSQVVQCDEVLVNFGGGLTQGGDMALLQLVSSVEPRLPVPIETYTQTVLGDPIVMLGHPARMPLKAEYGVITHHALHSDLHGLGGSSGSPMINLATGKLVEIVTSSDWEDWGVIDPQVPCVDLCFECDGTDTFGTRADFLRPFVDPVGLQLSAAATDVDYYGPPTTAADYEEWEMTLSVPSNSLPPTVTSVSWALHQEDRGAEMYQVVNSPDYELGDGEQTVVKMLPYDWVVATPGVLEKVVPFFDYTYATRVPIVHRTHSGVDGFTVNPSDDLVDEGPGVPHGTSRISRPQNRWIISQDLTVSDTAGLDQAQWQRRANLVNAAAKGHAGWGQPRHRTCGCCRISSIRSTMSTSRRESYRPVLVPEATTRSR